MSKTTLIVTSMLSAIIGGLIVALTILALAGRSGSIFDAGSNAYVPGTGYKVLTDFKCKFGEQKHILIRGADDGFALGNAEPTRRIPNLEDYPGYISNHPYLREYDDVEQDKIYSDFLEIPPNVSSGLFIVRLDPQSNYGNDVFSIGELSDMNDEYLPDRHHSFSSTLQELTNYPGWQHSSERILSARLKDIKFAYLPTTEQNFKPERQHKTLLSYVQAFENVGMISVLIHDDTGVDYMGAVVCTEPAENLGLTFSSYQPFERLEVDLQLFTCELDIKSEPCNPFVGDTLCRTARPLACFKDTGAPAPNSILDLPNVHQDLIRTRWGAGDIEFTPPIRGDTLATLADANTVCMKTFGEDWRVLDFHDGGLKGVASHRSSTAPNDRVWVDIKDQPRGTCWARTDVDQIDKVGLE